MSDHPTTPDTGDAALTGALNSSFRILRWLMALVAVAYVFSGVFNVHQGERAYVLVFGKIAGLAGERLLEPGLHWTWPRPIAEVVKIPTARVQTIDSATFWYKDDTAGTLRPGTDGYTLTGDANLIHSRWAIRYSVIDPEVVKFRLADLASILQRELDHAVLQCTAHRSVDQALRTEIEVLRGAVDAELRQRVEVLALGIRIERVDVLALAPPRQVTAAFASVIESEQDRSSKISAARAAASRSLNEAAGEAARLKSEGETYKRQIVAEVSASADYFTKVYEQYQKNPDIIAQTLLQDTLHRVLTGVDQKFLVHRNAAGQQQLRLLINPEPQPLTPPAKP